MRSEEKVRLVYRGGADLTFHNGEGQRVKVLKGEEFAVDAETAAILLTDPAVVEMAAEEAAAAEAAGYSGMTVKELLAMANERDLDVPAKSKKDDFIAALEGSDAAGADEPAEPEAAAEEAAAAEAAEEPESAGSGAITLGEMPDSAKVKG